MKKSVKIALAAVIVVPILAAAALPLFVNANTFRPIIEDRLSKALSRKVTLGDLSFSLLTGSLVAKDLSIAEDPNFGQTPFFAASRLRIGIQMKPLLFHKQLLIRSFEADSPQIRLIRAEDGTWNFASLSHTAPRQFRAARRAARPSRRPHNDQGRQRPHRRTFFPEESPGLRPAERPLRPVFSYQGVSIYRQRFPPQ